MYERMSSIITVNHASLMLWKMNSHLVLFGWSNHFQACKSFVNDGECVSTCPSGKVYNQHYDLDLQENVGGKLTYGILCTKNCPREYLNISYSHT